MNTKIKYPVLVVDDEDDLRELIQMTLVKMGLEVETAAGVIEGKRKLGNRPYSLVLTDMRMPDGTGLEIVEFINDNGLDIPVAVITAYGNADNAVEALKRGAFDYLQKPITLAQLRTLVKSAIKIDTVEESSPTNKAVADTQETDKQRAIKLKDKTRYGDLDFDFSLLENKSKAPPPPTKASMYRALEEEQDIIKEEQDNKKEAYFEKIVEEDKDNGLVVPRLLGESLVMKEVKGVIFKLSNTTVPVYISGESGTGKEQAARSIHELSDRKEQPFVAVNCGAIPENLMESEFFGYKKGSFTGADSDKDGFFYFADKGTIFLDEVADLPLTMQVKLLRVIQEKMVRRIGDNKERAVDVRILCATHKNLEKEVKEGRFRQDLYYRLNVITLSMPPLRELKDDLPKLIRNLLKKFSGSNPIQVTPEAFKMLLKYDYPGNFRELENILERAVALSSNYLIRDDDLQLRAVINESKSDFDSNSGSDGSEKATISSEDKSIDSLIKGEVTLQDLLDTYEKDILTEVLKISKFNRTQAAKLLGISFRSIRYRLERLGIE